MIEPEEETTLKQDELTSNEEAPFEHGLRPRTLQEFVGQPHIKEHLAISMAAAKKRGDALEHILLHGNPGLGKTSLAHVIAEEMGAQVRVTSGPALERVGDLAAILSNLKAGDILFVDEIHRLNKSIEEVLYPAMEDYVLDIIVGKGPTARTLRLSLEHFTLIGATTRLSMISSPLRDRFTNTFHLEFYSDEDMEAILKRSAHLMHVTLHDDAARDLATRARRTPRVGNRLLKHARDFSEVTADGTITQGLALGALKMLDVDGRGLNRVDRQILSTMIEQFGGGPVGLQALSSATGQEVETIEDVHEPFLLQTGLIERTPRGRKATREAYLHLQMTPNTIV